MKNELIVALTKQNGFAGWKLDGCAIEDIADIASRIFNSPADSELGGNETVLYQVRFHPEDHRTYWQNCHPDNFHTFVSDPDYATRELIVKPTVPADIIADAEWLVRWLPDESQQRTYALTIRNWMREHAAKIDQSQEAGNV